MPEQYINIGVFVLTQICVSLVVVTKLQAGEMALKEGLTRLTEVVDGLTSTITSINITDAKVDGRIVLIESRLALLETNTAKHSISLVAIREKYHSLSGFLQATYPGWTEIEKSRFGSER